MKVSAKADVIGEFDKLKDALVEGPANWMPGMYESPTGKIMRLEADSPLGVLARYARFRTETALIELNEVTVRLDWQSLENEAIFPVFQGRLHLRRGTDATHQLELEGVYDPPGGVIGHAADAAAMHAVAQLTVEELVRKIAGVLARNALGRSVKGQVASGRLTLDQEPPGC